MLKQAQQRVYILFLLLGIVTFGQTTVIINEDFSGGVLPTGWNNIDNGSSPISGQIWEFNSARGISAGDINGNYAILNSDNYGNGNSQNATLETREFDTGIYDVITLEFDYQYRDYQSPESCIVEVFNGATWETVASYTTNSGANYIAVDNGATHVILNITTQSNAASNVKVRFTYTGDWDYWWAIDNVKVTGETVPTNTTHLGPGGVGGTDGGTSLVLWLNANDINADGITTNNPANSSPLVSWNDLSGYANSYTQGNTANQPTFNKTSINGYPAANFDGSDFMSGSDNSYNEGTALFVLNASDFTSRSRLFNKAGSTSIRFEQWNNSGNIGFTRYGVADYDSGINSPFGLDAILSFSKQSAANSYEIRKLTDTLEDSFTLNVGSTTAPISTIEFGNFTNGNVSEIIVYSTVLNMTEKIITDNYLTAKYGLTLQNNDFYTQDNSGFNFDHDVAGIGQATDGSNHTDSQGTGIVRMYNPSALANDEFLFWGRDNKATTTFVTNTSNYQERISTKWRVSKRNDVGSVSFILDLNGIDISGKQLCSALKLVVDNDGDLLSPTSTYELTDVGGGFYKASNVVFADNDYFTIEYQDLIVVDGTKFYNGSGALSVPNNSDSCYKLLVKSTATGTLALTENANVREVEVEAGGKLVINSNLGLEVAHGVQLNGDIRLIGGAQLMQTHLGTSTITGSGKLYVDQNSEVESIYLYNYFSSPVATVGQNNYTVASVMKDGTTPTSLSSLPSDIGFIAGLDGNFNGSPIQLANRWIYTYDDLGSGTYAYDNNSGIGSTKVINPGKGYILKGPGRAQNYTFVGTPNDGNYTYTGVPSGVNVLIGNPYPSAFNIQKFLTDNSSIGATAYLWQQADVSNAEDVLGHYSSGYNGDYATINTSTSTQATAPTQVDVVIEAESAILGGGSSIVGDKVELTSASDNLSFNFNKLSKPVDGIYIVYESLSSKNIDIDINSVSQLTSVNLPNTSGVLTTLKVLVTIQPDDIVLLKSNDANLTAIDKVFGRQEYSYTAPPFNHLAIAQGFFFNTDNAGDLLFNNSQRALVPEGTGGSYFLKTSKKDKIDDLPILKLGMDFSPILNQVYHKQIAISFKEGNSFDYDRGFDSKISDRQVTDMYWKFPEDDSFYTIAGVEQIKENLEIPLEIIIEKAQTVSINIDKTQNINNLIYLKDTKLDLTYNLMNSSAKLNLDAGLYENRFYIVFKESTLSIEDDFLMNSFKVYHNRKLKELTIQNNTETNIKQVLVYNLLGQKIIEVNDEFQLNKKEVILKTNSLSNSIYIITIETEEGVVSKKFF
ncbi:hypothetical protein CW731_12510 [Polaribacter sp. ALD11]|uniref:T9SS type A sorting domain-containing protein n=1 Tax=Polaribacter sp. ALD11 TaxID=2058137 RepID=UPI000C306480|nr:T9SS type A sorting domain-containing protein [Polaribacter sp. ALD11]AUC86051.1 hypothetical protein CW731_12510 [Polaribacter sp. ALD11]